MRWTQLLWMTLALAIGIPPIRAADPVDYAKSIKPILRERCYACHGALKQESGLRLDTGELIRKGAKSNTVVEPGQPDESTLVERISETNMSLRMPPEGEPLSPDQVALFRRWIEEGAASPQGEKPEEDPRDHWAFRPPVRPSVPPSPSGHPIDGFLAQDHAAAGLAPQGPASKPVLLRRLYLDLVGIPPTREELRAFLADSSPDAYEKVVDRLLASPLHGERWGRHWMDVWRYSDWYGRRHVPDVWNSAPQIWRWRDWIVRSLNNDVGYDRMVQQMLAADEVAPDDPDSAVATGYLVRNWYALNPNDWMRNTVEHTGKAFLGLTFNCAHCHDHKYDPIQQDDYFKLRAFFEPMGMRQDRVAGEADPGPFQEYEYSVLRKIQRLGAVRVYDKSPEAPTWFYTGGDERNRVKDRGPVPPGVPAFLASFVTPKVEPVALPPAGWYPGARPGIQESVLDDARRAVATAAAELSAAHPIGDAWSLDLARARFAAAQAELKGTEARIQADRARWASPPLADCDERGLLASQRERESRLRRAEALELERRQALAVVKARPESDAKRAADLDKATKDLAQSEEATTKARAALTDESKPTAYTPITPTFPQTSTGRRKALAQWITARENPLPARVAVNHVWMRHFHTPLVASVFDFGRNGSRPIHPELLDWLAVELMENGWSLKHLHRLIVTSEAYKRSSSSTGAESWVKLDPENRRLWRMTPGRMEAEVVRDSLLAAAGRLDTTMGGQELENGESLTTYRRSLYYAVFPEQGGKSAVGELFDGPDPQDCYRRTRSVVPQQALALTNSDLVHAMSALLAPQLVDSAALPCDEQKPDATDSPVDSDRAFVVACFEQILSRPPTDAELGACRDYLASGPSIGLDNTRVRESLVRALFNHNDFVTIR